MEEIRERKVAEMESKIKVKIGERNLTCDENASAR